MLINLSFLINKPTGITTYALNLIPYLRSLDPTFLISPVAARLLPTPQTQDTYYPIPANLTPEQGTVGHLRRLFWTQLQLPQIYRQLRSQLLFSPVPEAPLYTRCHYIVTVHDLIPLRFPRLSPLTPYHRYYIPQVLSQAQHVICNSTATASDIIDFFHIPAAKITPIPLAYDANHFRWLNLAQQNETRPYFIYIGRHDPHKNLHRLIAAFAKMSSCQNCDLLLAGTGDRRYTPKLEAQSIELGIADRVKFLDYIPYEQLPILLNRAIALVFPSLWEGFGLPVLEAMACGTPVITSNLSSLPEVTGDAALLVNPYNIEEITAAMESIVTDRQLRSRLSNSSLTRASQFSWGKTGLATVEVLKRFL
ncbi:mannosyltransferase [Chroococcidiopsis sp. CCALA 051]|uniref:glycosyltransferase family 4 protein n=1 Tax=Chroococcidiopsis sp. CCALA 051 TaxID=869949 RepID=UPI000D0DC983|nr:glycosyltransferase family 1 protein [Chroococcidiopsis sp. CCALA 051]PSM48773.1 mannosyltransferase [Chroococcidiopsis sp. CCALA 051]